MDDGRPEARLRALVLAAAPGLFVFLWSTGWISARGAVIDCDPLTFLAVRFVCALAVFAVLVAATRAPMPRRGVDAAHAMVSGVLMHAVYLGGVWWAVGQGLPAGISAVIAATQPIMTALLAPRLLGERIGPKQWAGIGLGFAGIVVVLWPRLVAAQGADFSRLNLALAVNMVGMVAVTAGTFYQKRFIATGDLRTTALLQYVGAVPPVALAAWWLEPLRFTVSWTSMATLAWSVLAISLGAILLYLWLIRNGAVSRAASLIYLVPAASALEAWVLFGETLLAVQVVGIAITVAGVALATRKG
jgi:drug/metabolite transporter (DMT)-like permease